jgi:hypothetical protein
VRIALPARDIKSIAYLRVARRRAYFEARSHFPALFYYRAARHDPVISDALNW